MKKIKVIYKKIKRYKVNKFCKPILGILAIFFVISAPAAEQPQQIISCANKYYLDYYTKLAEVVNRLNYVGQVGTQSFSRKLWCPGYCDYGWHIKVISTAEATPSILDKGKNNNMYVPVASVLYDDKFAWQDRESGHPGIYDEGIDKKIVIDANIDPNFSLVGGEYGKTAPVYYIDSNNNDLYDDNETCWFDRKEYFFCYNWEMNDLMFNLRLAVRELYTTRFINHNVLSDDLSGSNIDFGDIPHLIEYDDNGNITSSSVKLFPERSGQAAYQFTMIPTHLSDGTQIADSPVYAENWDEYIKSNGKIPECPILKIHFDEIRELLNRNDCKWTLSHGSWDYRGEDNRKTVTRSSGNFTDALTYARNAFDSGRTYKYTNSPRAGSYYQDSYSVYIERIYSYLSLLGKYPTYSRTVDFYVKGGLYTGPDGLQGTPLYNNNGDPVYLGVWNRFEQHSDSTATEEYAIFGNLSYPSQCSLSSNPCGYQVIDSAIICKWDLPEVNIEELPSLYANVPDVDLDDSFDIVADFDSLEFETGTFVHLPERDNPQLYLPVTTDYYDLGAKRRWTYIGQGNKKNKYDAYFSHLPRLGDVAYPNLYRNSESYLYSSSNSMLFFDIWIDDSVRNIHIKRIGVVRPNQQAVIFDFPWDSTLQKFSEIGYPTGIHKNRTYRLSLYAVDEGYGGILYARLSFKNSIQCFKNSYSRSESGIYALNRVEYTGSIILSGNKFIVNNSLGGGGTVILNGMPFFKNSAKYDFGWEVDVDGRLYKIFYTTNDVKEKITVTLGYDSEGKVVKLTKNVPESMAVNGQTTYEISVSGNTITYPGGRTSTRTQSAAAGEARTVTITDTDPSSGTVEKKYEYNSNEQLVKYTQTANGKSAETSYTYNTGSEIYSNGSRKDQKLKSVVYPDGSWKYYEYDSNGHIAKVYTPDTGSGQDPEISKNYIKYNYAAHEEIDYEKILETCETLSYFTTPSAIEWFFKELQLTPNISLAERYYGDKLTSKKLYSNSPLRYFVAKKCLMPNSDWNNSNFDYLSDFYDICGNEYYYQIRENKEKFPLGEFSYFRSGSNVVTFDFRHGNHYHYSRCCNKDTMIKDSYGKEYLQTSNLYFESRNTRIQSIADSGKVIYFASSDTDSFGRIIKTTYLDGTTTEFKDYCLWGPQAVVDREGNTTEFKDYCLWGPQTVVDREGNTTLYTYTANGLIEHIEQKTPISKQISISYDALGNVTQRSVTVNGKTETETYAYDAQSRILSHTDTAGVTWNYQYNGQDVTMTGPDGKTKYIDYNPDGTIASITGNSVSPVFYEYGSDGLGFWKKTVHGDNAQADIWEKEYYNMLGQLCLFKTSTGYSENYEYDSKGRLAFTSDSNNNQVSQIYDARSRVIQKTVNGTTTSYTYGYDTRDGKTTYKTTASTPSPYGSSITSEQEVSLDGLDFWSTVNGRTDHTAVTRHGGGRYTTTTTDFEGTVTSVSNSANISNLTMNAPGLSMELATDSFGRTISTKVRGQETKYNYHADSGLLDKITGSDGKTTSISYSSGTATPSQISLPGGYSVTPTFNKLDLLEKLTGNAPGNFDVTKSFDTLGRENNLATTGQPGTINTVRSYNASTGALASKNIHGVETYNITYHNDGRINTISSAVDSGSSVTKTLQYTASPKYLFAGISYSDSTPDVSVSGHDSTFGLPSTISTSGVITYALEYNSDLQLTAANVTSGVAGSKSVGYTYSNLRRSGMTLGGNTVSYQYDTAKRLLTVTSGDVQATYDYFPNSVNKIQKVTIKKGGQVVSTREIALESNSNRVASVTNKDGSGTVLNSFAYNYDAKGDISEMTREDGSSWAYSYDKLGQLAGAQRSSDGVVRVGDTYKYEYDTITNVLKGGRTDVDGNFEFTATPSVFNNVQARMVGDKILVNGEAIENANIAVYAGTNATASVLASRKGKEFFATLDANNATAASGMLLNIIASYFDANATPEAGGDQSGNLTGADIIKEAIGMLVMPKQNEDPVYDDGGRMLLNSIYSCTWDAENRLTEVESQIKLDGTNRYKVTNAYDHAGRRIRKAVYTNDDSGWVLKRTHKYFYDTVRLGGGSADFGLLTEEEVTDNSASTTTVYQYLWGLDLDGTYHGLGGVGGLLAVIDQTNGKVYVPQMDAKGSVYKYIDATDGSVAAEFDYGPYGRVMHRTGAQVANLNLRYQTKYHDTELNTYYYGLRHYDPTICRWLSRDPLEEHGIEVNMYAFLCNDPINNIDYLGLDTWYQGWIDGAWQLTKDFGAGFKNRAFDPWVDVAAFNIKNIAHPGRLLEVQAAGAKGVGTTVADTYNAGVEKNTNRITTQVAGGRSLAGATASTGAAIVGDMLGFTPAMEGLTRTDIQSGRKLSIIESISRTSTGTGQLLLTGAAFKASYTPGAKFQLNGAYRLNPSESASRLGSRGSTSKTTFYVTPEGTAVPATFYRYANSRFAPLMQVKSGLLPTKRGGIYLSFDKIDDAIIAQGKLQIPYRPDYVVSGDTLDIIDQLQIPYGKWGQAHYLEPLTRDFSKFGPGKASQIIVNGPVKINPDSVFKFP